MDKERKDKRRYTTIKKAISELRKLKQDDNQDMIYPIDPYFYKKIKVSKKLQKKLGLIIDD